MADFQEQVMGITGLTIDGSSTAPSRSEFSTFLNDGVIDVTNKVIILRPQDREFFIRESSTTASNGLDIGGASIISVIREAGADGDTDGSTAWRSCRKISAAMQSRVVDVNSLHFASKYNPAYAIDDNGVVNVYPIPDGTNDGFRAYYINNVPAEADGTALIHSSSGIKYFPKDKVYLVVLYSSIKSLQSALSAVDISTFSLTPVPPDVPTSPTFTLGTVGTLPTLSSAQTFAAYLGLNPLGHTISDPDAFVLNAVPPEVLELPDFTTPSIGDEGVSSVDVSGVFNPTGNGPTFNSTAANTALGAITTALGDDDIELATGYVQEVQVILQEELNIFNAANVEYQAELQQAISESQIKAQEYQTEAQITSQKEQQEASLLLQKEQQEYANILQRFNAEIQEYQAEVGSEVQEYTQKLGRYTQEVNLILQAWQKQESDKISSLQAEVAKYNADLQTEIQKAKLEQSDEYVQELSKFQAEVQEYQAEVAGDIQGYQQEVAEKSAEYQWQTARLQDLKQEYNQAFALMAPAPPQQQQAPRRRARA